MSLQGIFDPMVRAYFAGKGGSGGGSDDGNQSRITVFDLVGKGRDSEPIESSEIGTVYYIGKETPVLQPLNFLVYVDLFNPTISFFDISNGEVSGSEDGSMILLMKDGEMLFSMAEGGEITPEMVGVPDYGTYVTGGWRDEMYVILGCKA